jgi:hypothetical protein
MVSKIMKKADYFCPDFEWFKRPNGGQNHKKVDILVRNSKVEKVVKTGPVNIGPYLTNQI